MQALRPKERDTNFENLTPEQMEKARSCKTPDELLALAKAEGYELTSEELESVAGGSDWLTPPDCIGKNCTGYTYLV